MVYPIASQEEIKDFKKIEARITRVILAMEWFNVTLLMKSLSVRLYEVLIIAKSF